MKKLRNTETDLKKVLFIKKRVHSVNLHIQSQCWKIRTRKNSVFGNFSGSVCEGKWFFIIVVDYYLLGTFYTNCLSASKKYISFQQQPNILKLFD